MKTIRYQKMTKMEPRDGVRYSTTYVKQTLEQRKELTRHVRQVVTEIADALEGDELLMEFALTPLKGFKTTQGANRSIKDLLTDMVNEGAGKTKQGLPKDFALAPIERWNKLFEGTDYEISLVQTFGPAPNKFNDLMEIVNQDD